MSPQIIQQHRPFMLHTGVLHQRDPQESIVSSRSCERRLCMPPIIGRRQFLQFATLSALGPTLTRAACAPTLPGGKARFTPSLNAYTFLEDLSVNLADSSNGIDIFGACDFCVW